MAYKQITINKKDRLLLIELHNELIEYMASFTLNRGHVFLCNLIGWYLKTDARVEKYGRIRILYERNLHNEKPTKHLNKEFFKHRTFRDSYVWWQEVNNSDTVDSNEQRKLFLLHLNTKLNK